MRKLMFRNSALDHNGIKDRVMGQNDEVRFTIAREFRPFRVLASRLSLCAVGSDGRLEKGDKSPLELVLYHREIERAAVRELSELADSLLDHSAYPITDGMLEAKSVGRDEMTYAFGDHRKAYPSRVMDSYPIFGNSDVLEEAKLRMLDEWNSPAGKKIIKTIKERRKSARRIMLSGRQRWKGEDVYHFSLERGKAFYGNEEGLQIRSVKPGPLRFVQSAIEVGMVILGRELTRDGKHAMAADILRRMPTPTIDKLTFLDDIGVLSLSSSDVEKICDCYLSFLKIYHASEAAFVDGGRMVRFDRHEARERIDLLANLLETPLMRE